MLFQYPDLSGLLDKVGVKVESVKSSPLKAEPSGFTPTTPEARAALAAVVGDTYAWFKGLVAERRGMDAGPAQRRLGRAGVQRSPERAAEAGGRTRQRAPGRGAGWRPTAGSRRICPIKDWKPTTDSGFSLWSAAGIGADLLGLEGLAARLRTVGAEAQAARGGLLALWRPEP